MIARNAATSATCALTIFVQGCISMHLVCDLLTCLDDLRDELPHIDDGHPTAQLLVQPEFQQLAQTSQVAANLQQTIDLLRVEDRPRLITETERAQIGRYGKVL